ncbi:bacteriocin-type signal sequence-containing protein [Terribacillus saccharophilus]|uniref:Bacteriocin-type signal sequence-containing protein n=1 Tax=Terribacillus saccharophilus TaxID=361277 RepID=A0AAX2EJM9_9BACI|nr:bacteriocin-type signal sequence-containing protein [Terribacillus saccharophilus]
MENKFTKKTFIQNKYSMNKKNPAGDLFEEISEQDMSQVSGGTSNWASKNLANARGLKGNYGQICTLSAECGAFTKSCGD